MHVLERLLLIEPLKRCAFIRRFVLDNELQRFALGERFRQWNGQRATHDLMMAS